MYSYIIYLLFYFSILYLLYKLMINTKTVYINRETGCIQLLLK